jgi:TatD DNase family protein
LNKNQKKTISTITKALLLPLQQRTRSSAPLFLVQLTGNIFYHKRMITMDRDNSKQTKYGNVSPLIDIAVNLTDEMYQGVYHGKKYHEPDLTQVLKRAREAGVEQLIVTGTSIHEMQDAIHIVKMHQSGEDIRLRMTVGIHPTRCNEFEQEKELLNNLALLIENHREHVVAVGECGLDYDRLNFCSKEIQIKYFQMQFELAKRFHLPMFLHHRAAQRDFIEILSEHRDDFTCAVVHSFDASWDMAQQLLNLKPNGGIFIGLNGCSMKTEENLRVIEQIPLSNILLETDAPWCDVRPSHASYKHLSPQSLHIIKNNQKKKEKFEIGFQVKTRNEPCNIQFILDVLSSVKKMDREQVAQQVYKNTLQWLKNESKS